MNEVLSEKAKKIFRVLGKFKGFYLAGGTALALQLKHRVSIDFDLFSNEEIQENLLREVEKVFYGHKIQVSVNNHEELTVFVDSVKITFLHYPFPVYSHYSETEGVKIILPKQIGFTKAYSIGRRGSYKDYVDLYFLLKNNYISVEEVIKSCEKIFGDGFNSRLFLEQLVYMDDVDEVNLNFLKVNASKKDLESYFSAEVGKFGRRI